MVVQYAAASKKSSEFNLTSKGGLELSIMSGRA
jgi:hypothetical protein